MLFLYIPEDRGLTDKVLAGFEAPYGTEEIEVG